MRLRSRELVEPLEATGQRAGLQAAARTQGQEGLSGPLCPLGAASLPGGRTRRITPQCRIANLLDNGSS